jgi:carbonic anhydrase
MKTQTKEAQAALTPKTALDLLRAGNERFQANVRASRNLLEQVQISGDGQFPCAVVLSCIDSRTSAELMFDQGPGDVFSVRIAGNVVNEDILGSMEFACKLAGSKLVVVVGHSLCGAVGGACDGAELGYLTGLLKKVQPAIAKVGQEDSLPRDQRVQLVAEANVDHAVSEVRAKSEVLEAMIGAGEIGIIGAMYDVKTGAVTWGELATGAS